MLSEEEKYDVLYLNLTSLIFRREYGISIVSTFWHPYYMLFIRWLEE
jgi:hypothetical protein